MRAPKLYMHTKPFKGRQERDRFNKQDSRKGEEKNVSLTNSA